VKVNSIGFIIWKLRRYFVFLKIQDTFKKKCNQICKHNYTNSAMYIIYTLYIILNN